MAIALEWRVQVCRWLEAKIDRITAHGVTMRRFFRFSLLFSGISPIIYSYIYFCILSGLMVSIVLASKHMRDQKSSYRGVFHFKVYIFNNDVFYIE